ncbi:MAG TPA: hypothetical protein VMS21_06745 [Methylomirabilota bacterium]|nr:hypothetical protein [Methylomirabilota bacterium]
MSLAESIVEDAALEWFGELGYAVGHGPRLAPGEPASRDRGRDSFGEVALVGRLREVIRRLNRATPSRTLATLCDPVGTGLLKLLSGELSGGEASGGMEASA